MGLFQHLFKDFIYNVNVAHGVVVGNLLWIILFMYWAKRQSIGTITVVMEFANGLDKGSKAAYAAFTWMLDNLPIRVKL